MVNKQGTIEISLESIGLKLISSNEPREFVSNTKDAESDELQCLDENVVFISEAENDKTASILVLGRNLLDTIRTQSLARYKLIYQKSLSVDYKSIIPRLTTSELEQKLSDISQENVRLKEALESNNLSMKHVLHIIISKQKELASVHEARRRKVVEMKNQLRMLKTKNDEYKKQIEHEAKAVKDPTTQTEKQDDRNDIPAPSPVKDNELKMPSLQEKCEKQDQKIVDVQTVVASFEERSETSDLDVKSNFRRRRLEKATHESEKEDYLQPWTYNFAHDAQSVRENMFKCPLTLRNSRRRTFQHLTKRVPALAKTESPPVELGGLTEDLQTLGGCCGVHLFSRYTSISEGLERCKKIVMEKRNASEIEGSLRLLESLICGELIHLKSMLIDGNVKKNCEPERVVAFEMEVEKLFSSYNLKLREIEYLRKDSSDPLTGLQVGDNFEEQNSAMTIAGLGNGETLLKEAQRSFEQVTLYLTRQREELNQEKIRIQNDECKLIKANVLLHEEITQIRESNDLLRVQLNLYETDWNEQRKVCEVMRKKEIELIDHIRKLEEEKRQWLIAMQCFEKNSIE